MEALLYFFSEELTLIENPEAWFVAKKKNQMVPLRVRCLHWAAQDLSDFCFSLTQVYSCTCPVLGQDLSPISWWPPLAAKIF